jgi:uncharacterized protein (TIGR03437 family)
MKMKISLTILNLALILALRAAAQSPSATVLTYNSGPSVNLEQIIGDCDWQYFDSSFAGLVAVGQFQINFTVPRQFANVPEGNYPITISVNGVSSPSTINSDPPGQLALSIQH